MLNKAGSSIYLVLTTGILRKEKTETNWQHANVDLKILFQCVTK